MPDSRDTGLLCEVCEVPEEEEELDLDEERDCELLLEEDELVSELREVRSALPRRAPAVRHGAKVGASARDYVK